jgi:two-component system, OmpR family, response regulator RegX3
MASDWMNCRVLLVEREGTAREELSDALRRRGLVVEDTECGADGLRHAPSGRFDAVIADLAAPGLYGLEGCRQIRTQSDVPILVTSEDASVVELALALELGADDYVARPFSTTEVVSRVGAILRRRRLDTSPARPRLRAGDIELDLTAHRVTVDGRAVSLTPMEFGILAMLAREPGRVFTPREILRELWDSDHVGSQGACKTHVAKLRAKLGAERIVTVRGRGYLLLASHEIVTGLYQA